MEDDGPIADGDVARDFPIQTPRLMACPLTFHDLDSVASMHGDVEVMRYINHGETWPREQSERIVGLVVNYYATRYAKEKWLDWLAMKDRVGNEFIGICCLPPMRGANGAAAGGGPYMEFGYRIVRQHWGKGFATEISAALVAWGFERLCLPEIVAIADERNAPSNRVIEKTGLHYERTFEREGLRIRLHRITRDEYRRQKV